MVEHEIVWGNWWDRSLTSAPWKCPPLWTKTSDNYLSLHIYEVKQLRI